ncbi:MAG: FtsX-like permease family protein, partial [Myxococcales bacterium]
MVSALQRKLLRDLGLLKGQVITVALVVGLGVACAISLASTHLSLRSSMLAWYERGRLADVFATCKRAPRPLLATLEAVPGVSRAEARIVEPLALDLPDLPEPAMGMLISVPSSGPLLNVPHLRTGRFPEPGRPGEVVVGEAFANARRLRLGDAIGAVLNGRRTDLRVVGTALSPEFIIAMSPTGYDDDERFALLWMDEQQLAAAFRMEGAFNDLALRLAPGAWTPNVVAEIDRLLVPYGGQGARERARQMSHRTLENELNQLQAQATWIPMIFMLVAAFLVNVVLSRLVGTQREQVAALKAMGYSSREIGIHFLEFAAVVVCAGSALGLVLGDLLGRLFTDAYLGFFRFPSLRFRMDVETAIQGIAMALLSGLGAIYAVRAAVRLPPAEGMRPPSPPVYSRLILDRLGVGQIFSQRARMVLRDLHRKPLRLLVSSTGVAMAVGVVILGRFSGDSIDWMLSQHFDVEQRADLEVSFRNPIAVEAVDGLRAVPGVLRVEPARFVPVRLRHGHLAQDAVLQGLPAAPSLRRALGPGFVAAPPPPWGMAAPEELFSRLGAALGDEVTVEALDGTGRTARVRLTERHEQLFGLIGTLEIHELDALFGDQGAASGAGLQVDSSLAALTSARLKDHGSISGATSLPRARRRFAERNTDFLNVITAVVTACAIAIAIGVIYNDARVALEVRSRDLATLRVLGCTRREVSSVLLGELAAAIPLAL